MTVLFLILFVLGAGCFLAAAIGVGGRVNLLALGLFLWILVPLLQLIDRLA